MTTTTRNRPKGSHSATVRPAYRTEKGQLIDADLFDQIVETTTKVCDLMFTEGVNRRQRRAISKAYHALRSITPKVEQTRTEHEWMVDPFA